MRLNKNRKVLVLPFVNVNYENMTKKWGSLTLATVGDEYMVWYGKVMGRL